MEKGAKRNGSSAVRSFIIAGILKELFDLKIITAEEAKELYDRIIGQ